ncbi:hypothetical protein CR51_18755 [Caballeronia megalochromosomata]|nr:hypothetical protein CR51_18755 [Caballeronia megalochromosomata]
MQGQACDITLAQVQPDHPSKKAHKTSGDYSKAWQAKENCDIQVLVCAAEHYIVYIDSHCGLNCVTSRAYDEAVAAQRKQLQFDSSSFEELRGEIKVLEQAACECMDMEVRKRFLSILGSAIVCSLQRDYAGAKKRISDATSFIQARTEEKSRVWYLSSVLVPRFLSSRSGRLHGWT